MGTLSPKVLLLLVTAGMQPEEGLAIFWDWGGGKSSFGGRAVQYHSESHNDGCCLWRTYNLRT